MDTKTLVTKVNLVTEQIIEDLCDRGGFADFWGDLESEEKTEIMHDIACAIATQFAESSK